MSWYGTLRTAIAICTIRCGFASVLLSTTCGGSAVTCEIAVLARLNSVAGLPSTPSDCSLRTSELRNCCWFEMRPRSDPSPMP
jgi:hypothetical protein